MKQKKIYGNFFVLMIKQSIKKRQDKELAEKAIRKGKKNT